MKNLFCILFLTLVMSVNAQVAINTDGSLPDNSAMLDVKSTTKGLLIPRMTATQRNAIAGPATGLMIYQTDNTPGYYYNFGTSVSPVWVMTGTGSFWGLTGNSGTSAGSNFIGTTDNVPIVFKVYNQLAGKIDHLLFNTSLGYQSLPSNTTGYDNMASGSNALYSNTTGYQNTANGESALYSNTTGAYNTACGYRTLYSNTTANFNSAFGHGALINNTTGTSNTAIGMNALSLNTTGFNNTANGLSSLLHNTTGWNNTANGVGALYSNTIGYQNTASGMNALYSNTEGYSNTATGLSALYANTTGNNNTAYGVGSLPANINGDNNSANGFYSLYSNTTGSSNTANGYAALGNNLNGFNNAAIGASSLNSNTSGYQNTACGTNALFANTSGMNNSAFGFQSLYSSQGNWMTGLGHQTDVSSSAVTNSTVIGDAAIVNASNKVRIGDATMTVIEGQVAWSYPSDGRFKLNVTEEVKGLSFIKLLRPVVYNFDTRKYTEFFTKNMPDSLKDNYLNKKDFEPSMAVRQSGFIAQEVLEAAKSSGYDFNGVHIPVDDNDNYSLAYSQFVVPLVKAVQELNSKNEELQIENETQKLTNEEMKVKISQLIQRIEKLENK